MPLPDVLLARVGVLGLLLAWPRQDIKHEVPESNLGLYAKHTLVASDLPSQPLAEKTPSMVLEGVVEALCMASGKTCNY